MDIHTTIANNELIAKFMNYEMEYHPQKVDVYNNKIQTFLVDGVWLQAAYMKYNKSWDWQIPVWCDWRRRCKLLYTMLPSDEKSPFETSYGKQLREYHDSVNDNDINTAYIKLINAINFYNRIKQKTDVENQRTNQ